jgi:hypothetical protein
MHNYLNYKSLKKIIFLFILIGCINYAHAQTDSLLQSLLVDEKMDSQLIAPTKMLITQKLIWGNNGILKNRYGSTQDLVERRKIDLRIRRKMLQIHQIGGFVTLGGMLAQGIVGSQLYNGSYKLKETHEKLGTVVNLTYGLTAVNSLFTPPSTFKRDKKLTSIRLHKWLAIVHMTGMIATNILGTQIEKNPNLKPYHRAAAYTSFVSLAAATVVIKF